MTSTSAQRGPERTHARGKTGASRVQLCCCARCRAARPSTTCGPAPSCLVVFGFSVLLTFYPGWMTIGLAAVLVAAAVWIAHIPRGALPSMPRWLWILLAFGAFTAALAGGDPDIAIGGAEIGLGGLLNFLRITVLSIVLLALGAMVSWTTNVADIAPCGRDIGPAAAGVSHPGR